MLISLIVAMDENRGIGLEGKIPWRLPADQAIFKKLTMGHHMIMGRKTYESIGRPLPGRQIVIVTRNLAYTAPGCDVAHSLEAAFDLARSRGETEVFNIGGATLYAPSLQVADRIYLTIVHAVVSADTFFPVFDESKWIVADQWAHPADSENEYAFTFKQLERK